ncbi:hypothetical protein [Herbidospora sp. RD11066]
MPTAPSVGQIKGYSDTTSTGTTLAAAGRQTVQLWDVATRQPVGNILHTDRSKPVQRTVFSPDGKILAGGGFTFNVPVVSVTLWQVVTGRTIMALTDPIEK